MPGRMLDCGATSFRTTRPSCRSRPGRWPTHSPAWREGSAALRSYAPERASSLVPRHVLAQSSRTLMVAFALGRLDLTLRLFRRRNP